MHEIFDQIHLFLINSGVPPELQVFFLSMLPVTELRASIPIGMKLLKLPQEATLIWAVAGNIVPTLIILTLTETICNFLTKHSNFFKNISEKIFEKTRNKHHRSVEKYGAIFLYIFVSIPLPGSGGWTGSLIAFLFGIKFWKAASAISLGILTAGILIIIGVNSISSLLEGLI